MKKIFSTIWPGDPVCGLVVLAGLLTGLVFCGSAIAEEHRASLPEVRVEDSMRIAFWKGEVISGEQAFVDRTQILQTNVDVAPDGSITDGENIIVRVQYALLVKEGTPPLQYDRYEFHEAVLLLSPNYEVIDTSGYFGYVMEDEGDDEDSTPEQEELRYLACL